MDQCTLYLQGCIIHSLPFYQDLTYTMKKKRLMDMNFQKQGQQKQRYKTLIKYDIRLKSITASHCNTQKQAPDQ